ncbi:MAG TPA: hypothetical protein PLM16_02470 [Candidatus Woesebacteria bacterium]|nr:hypothetical protein [Candidatus Woesebacteria bacterium]
MRIIKAFFSSLLIITVVVGALFLISREILLMMAVQRVKQYLVQVRDLDQQQAYAAECGSKGSSRDDNGRVHSTQLRFLDDSAFVVEVVCNQMEHAPIEITQANLPPFVSRELGKSGWRWPEPGVIHFSLYKREYAVVVADETIDTVYKQVPQTGGSGPPGACVSFGYRCCDSNIQQGAGVLATTVIDCPEQCFAGCEDRPLILNFGTQPYYNKLDRVLEIKAKEPVVYSFVVSPNQEANFSGYMDSDDPVEKSIATIEMFFTKEIEEVLQVTLDFGDGKQEVFTGSRGQVQHQYECAANECIYEASLKVIKDGRVESVGGPQNIIKVHVRPS